MTTTTNIRLATDLVESIREVAQEDNRTVRATAERLLREALSSKRRTRKPAKADIIK